VPGSESVVEWVEVQGGVYRATRDGGITPVLWQASLNDHPIYVLQTIPCNLRDIVGPAAVDSSHLASIDPNVEPIDETLNTIAIKP
jgi:hypothetical protein